MRNNSSIFALATSIKYLCNASSHYSIEDKVGHTCFGMVTEVGVAAFLAQPFLFQPTFSNHKSSDK